MPPIYPGLYPATPNHPPVHKITPHISKKEYKTDQEYKQHLSVFSDLIDDNIIDNIMLKEATSANSTYINASLAPDAPFMSVIIKKEANPCRFSFLLICGVFFTC